MSSRGRPRNLQNMSELLPITLYRELGLIVLITELKEAVAHANEYNWDSFNGDNLKPSSFKNSIDKTFQMKAGLTNNPSLYLESQYHHS